MGTIYTNVIHCSSAKISTQMLKEDKSLHIRVPSYEFHNEYACLMIYRNGVWRYK